MGTPDWVFRALGVLLFTFLIGIEVRDFLKLLEETPGGFTEAFLRSGVYWDFGKGKPTLYVPWGRLLYILTYVLIALSFVIRMAPLKRAARALEIVIPIIGAFWPFIPFVVKGVLQMTESPYYDVLKAQLFDLGLGFPRFLIGTGLIVAGNLLDVWGYAVLCRSLSIVAEARELKVTGPYRFVRHPVYLGQILAQAGVWLCFAAVNPVWWVFYACFVGFQLYRSRVEDEVLENAFGEPYREWKRRTFWFF